MLQLDLDYNTLPPTVLHTYGTQHSLLNKASGTVHSNKHSQVLIFQLVGPLFSKHMQTQQGILKMQLSSAG